MQTEEKKVSTGFIANNIDQLHKPGVLQEMKRLYLQEIEEFFTKDETGQRILRPEVLLQTNCPICDSGEDAREFEIKVNGFDHHRCLTCKNIYVSPRLKDEFVWKQYARPSYTYMFKNLIENTIQFRKDVIAFGKYKWVTKRLKNKDANKVLDIGSGFGENLAVYKENGWEVAGIEFNEYAANRSREMFDLHVVNEPIEEADLPHDQYDLITMWGVLEHLTEPIEIMGQIIKHLAPGGSVVFMVPNFDSLTTSYLKDHPEQADRHLDGDKHIMVYTKPGIEYLAKHFGLEVVDIVSRGLDFSSILEYCEDEKEMKLYKAIKKELPKIQRGIEEEGFGDGLWAVLSKP